MVRQLFNVRQYNYISPELYHQLRLPITEGTKIIDRRLVQQVE